MTTLPQQITLKQYLADGVALEFTYPFMILEDRDIGVYVTLPGEDPNPTLDKKVLNVDYTVTHAGDEDGGTIIFVDPPIALAVVTLNRQIEASVNTNFENASTFNGANLDDAFLRTTLVEQQNQTYALRRNLSYKVNSYLPDIYLQNYTQLPVLANGQIWKGQENGVTAVILEENPDVSTLRSDLSNNQSGTDGAKLIGYYDDNESLSTTVHEELQTLQTSINQVFKPGMILDFAGDTPPDGWLLCDGSLVSKTIYADLYAVLGTIWGAEGPTTFKLPDFRGRTTIGAGGVSDSTIGNQVGNYGGERKHTQTLDELFNHNHTATNTAVSGANTVTGPGWTHPLLNDIPRDTVSPAITTTIGNTGGGQPFNVIQPSAVINKIIKT